MLSPVSSQTPGFVGVWHMHPCVPHPATTGFPPFCLSAAAWHSQLTPLPKHAAAYPTSAHTPVRAPPCHSRFPPFRLSAAAWPACRQEPACRRCRESKDRGNCSEHSPAEPKNECSIIVACPLLAMQCRPRALPGPGATVTQTPPLLPPQPGPGVAFGLGPCRPPSSSSSILN